MCLRWMSVRRRERRSLLGTILRRLSGMSINDSQLRTDFLRWNWIVAVFVVYFRRAPANVANTSPASSVRCSNRASWALRNDRTNARTVLLCLSKSMLPQQVTHLTCSSSQNFNFFFNFFTFFKNFNLFFNFLTFFLNFNLF